MATPEQIDSAISVRPTPQPAADSWDAFPLASATAKGASDSWDAYPLAKAGRSIGEVASGLGKALDAGVAKGIAGIVGTPETIATLGAKGIHAATNFVEDKLGLPKSEGRDFSKPGMVSLPTAEKASDEIQRMFYGGKEPYKPQNLPEEYAQTIGEFAPAAIAPGGAISRAAQVVVPAAASETAGQITKGSAAEPWARGITAVAAGGLTSLASRPSTTARAIREQLPAGVTPQMVDQAAALIERGTQQGITLSWPEALSQVAGRPVMTNALRHLEGAPQTEARMAEFFGQRPQQVERAGRQAMDNIAPPNNAPSNIGPAVGREAEGIVDDTRGAINAASEPFYNRSAATIIPPADFARVQAVPGYAHAVRAIQRDPQLARYVQGLPENSVGYVNEVKKWLDTAAENAAAPVNAQRNMQRSAGFSSDATTARTAGINASADYETALAIQTQGRERFLQPLLNGPIGKLASKDTTTKAAIDALFPANPLPNSAGEIAQTVGALANRSPRVAADLVRAHTESVFNEATQALQTGANQMGGAKFRSVLVGNPQQRANFEAAVTALPNGADRLAGFNRFLDVVEATGTRQNVGSRTAYNAELLKNQSASGIIGDTAKAVTNPLKGAAFLAERYERWRLGRNLNELATILTDPGSVNQLRAIARMPAGSGRAQEIAARMILSLELSRGNEVGKPAK